MIGSGLLIAIASCDTAPDETAGDVRFVAEPDAIRDVFVSPLFRRVGAFPTSGIETITVVDVDGRRALRLADAAGTVKRFTVARAKIDSLRMHGRFRLTSRTSYRAGVGYLLTLSNNRMLALSMSWETGEDGTTETRLLLQKPPRGGGGLQTFSEVAVPLPVDEWIPFGFECDRGGMTLLVGEHRVRLDGYPEARVTTVADVALLVRDADVLLQDLTWNGQPLEPDRQLAFARLHLLKQLQVRELNTDHAFPGHPLAVIKPRLGGEFRDALNAVPPSRYTVEATVEAGMALAFGIGIEEPEGLAGDRTTVFRVVATDGAGRDHVLFRTDPGDTTCIGAWRDVRLDVSAFVGTTVRFRFETEATGESETAEWDLALWGDPRLTRAEPEPEKRRPNVLLISLDTLRPDRLGAYGYDVHDTSPGLDSLAVAGTLFENAYSHAPQTLLSHMSILTSRPPGLHGVTDRTRSLGADVVTLANVYSAAGYRTAAFTGAGFMQGRYGFHHGFHRYFERTDPDSTEFTAQILERTEEWLRRESDAPFFLFVHTYEPHVPLTHTRFVPDGHRLGLPEAYEDSLATAGRYDSGVRYTDTCMRRLFAMLRDSGAGANTIVVVLSDHGEELHDRGRGFQGHVDSVHRVVLWVPLILSGPGVPSGLRVPDRVGLMDVAPTLLDLCDVPVPPSFMGTSLRPALEGGALEPRSILSEGEYSRAPRRSVVESGLHLIHIRDFDDVPAEQLLPGDVETELYDVDRDPRERANVFDLRREEAEPLRVTLDVYTDLVERTERRGGTVVMDEETRRQLKGLGYIN